MSHFQRAEQAFLAGDFETAVLEGEQAERTQKPSLPAALLVSRALIRLAKPAEAVTKLKELSQRNPNNPEVWNLLAMAQRAAADHLGSFESARKAVRLQKHPLFLNTFGLAAVHLGKGDEALRALMQAVQLDPSVAALHRNLGTALVGLSRHPEARQEFETALRLDPRDLPSRLQLANLHIRHDRSELALQYAQSALDIDPTNAEAEFYRARSLTLMGRKEEALVSYRRAAELDHAFLSPFGIWLIEEARLDEAKEVLEKRVKLEPADGMAHHYLIEARRSPATAEDCESLRRVIADPDATVEWSAFANYSLGKALERQGDFGAAFDAYRKANEKFYGHRLRHSNDLVSTIDSEVSDLKSSMTRETLSRLGLHALSDARPIFIVGMIRTGTTLVEQIVSAHHAVCGAGELRYWMENGPTAVSNPELLKGIATGYTDLLDKVCPQSSRITDKMPLNLRFLGYICAAFPQAKVLWCRRDPMDVGLSVYTTPFTDPPIFSYKLSHIGHVIRKYEELMHHWVDVLPSDTILPLQYESLVVDQEELTRKVLDFLQLEFDPACLKPEDNPGAVRTPSSLQVRKPVYKTSVQRWKNFEPWLGDLKDGLGPLAPP